MNHLEGEWGWSTNGASERSPLRKASSIESTSSLFPSALIVECGRCSSQSTLLIPGTKDLIKKPFLIKACLPLPVPSTRLQATLSW